ncbi:MAG: cytochrome c peroxidase [Bacteroidota bacterium]
MAARNLLSYSACLFVLMLAMSCQDQQLESTKSQVYLDLPAQRFQYNNFNDTSNAIATLGRVLFYDKSLSVNSTIACGSCHKQSYGFADNKAFSTGFGGRVTTRNSMPVQNLAGSGGGVIFFDPGFGQIAQPQGHLFWDGREASLDKLVLQPIGNHIEMGVADAETLTNNLTAKPYYMTLFNDAFGSSEITTDRISAALSLFCASINTNNTRFDQFNQTRFTPKEITNEDGSVTVTNQASQTVLNPLEVEGMFLFTQKYDCNSCHNVQTPNGYLFTGTFANIGLDKEYTDPGRQTVTGFASDNGRFKIPSLRNVAYTGPYMHDGRFGTLEEVLQHYSEGIIDTPGLDPKLKDEGGHARSMNISEHESQAIIAFLHTLSDQSVLTDPKFSDPFKVKQ